MNYNEISACRISGSKNLTTVLNLGHQALTGVFPKSPNEEITSGPLELVWCSDSGLLQLKHSYNLGEMYGDNYGYRSGLNQSMVDHLSKKVHFLESLQTLNAGDTVLDIGSNDSTLLQAYKTKSIQRVGMDPTGSKFKQYYPEDVKLIPDFFSSAGFKEHFPTTKVKLITSIAMFYDLENPNVFVADIAEILDKEGVWHFEQSYMPSMLRTNSYDTICHEHLEFYSLSVVKNLLEDHGLRIIDVQMNSVNGGSFAITAARNESSFKSNDTVINWLLEQENRMGLHTPRPFRAFEERVFEHKENLRSLICSLSADGKKVFGYGASTKGNVLLQFCNFTTGEISCIAEVNPDKFGSYTPGTNIPIVSEEEARSQKPDYMLVLPWHFRDNIIKREQEYLAQGGKLIFPLPEIEIV
jgi:hypothetical protein